MTDVAAIFTGQGDQLVGLPLGATNDINGPLVVCTAAASPLAELRKPEYDGAIVVFATPHIGGSAGDLDGAVAIGAVVRDPATADPATGQASLNELLSSAGISGISGVDTRELTQLVTSAGGTMPAQIRHYPAT